MIFRYYIKSTKSKTAIFFIGVFATIFLYQITNRIHLREPQLLSFGFFDHITPFLPWTVWIYFSEYIIFLFAYLQLKDDKNVIKYFYSYTAILIFSSICFVLYPVTFPRNNYPVIPDVHGFSGSALNFLRNFLDTPANCLPSLHVSTCFISALCFWQESKKKFVVYAIWSLLVAWSTLTTKQHYFIDIVAAFFVTIFFYWYFFFRAKYRD